MASIAYTRVVDLSQEITPDLQVFPAYPKPAFLPWTTREAHGFAAEALFLISHAGTHIDAPLHYRPEGHALHELRPSRFVARAQLLDLRPQKPRARIRPRALRRALGRRRLARGDAILLRTGWERMRGRDAYLDSNPGLTGEGAALLVRWGASLVGVDTANLDLPDATDFPGHHTLLAADVPILENLSNLGAIRADTFTLVALPLRLRGATGSPVRAVALV